MTRSRSFRLLAGAAAVPLAALALAGCGGGASGSSAAPTTAKTAPPATTSGGPATVAAANEGNLGKILVDARGRTLYLFRKDTGTKSACFGECANAWPPLRASGKPTVGGGANAAAVGTTARSDGKPQVTYHGHPLYRFEGDQKPGDTNGQGITAFGARWFVLTPAGSRVSGQPVNSGGGSSSGGGNGY
jgi:predicted lipoprotein with Yx(FWY)xxD motif